MAELTRCPFCGEDDFDLIGLKMHYERGWCEAVILNPLSAPAPQQSSWAADPAIVKLVREIHQDLKRGSDTEDHGLLGNLRCIQDAVLNILHPIPDPMAAGAVAPPEQQELIARLRGCSQKINRELTLLVQPGSFLEAALYHMDEAIDALAEAISRSHEDGRRAGLEEAARQCTYEKLDAADTKDKVDYVYNRACDDCRTAIRALKTQNRAIVKCVAKTQGENP